MAKSASAEESGAPALYGLVLAGGDSHRMGRDKAQLRYYGDEPQVRHAVDLLGVVAEVVYVSVRSTQADAASYAPFTLVVDDGTLRGPAAGLVAAWTRFPDVAWLVLATDLPFVSAALIADLRKRRDASKLATAFRHPDGTPEPLCTVWEPAARPVLLERVGSGDSSLRRLLVDGPAKMLDAVDPGLLQSVDSEPQYEAARARIGAQALISGTVRSSKK
jgi:molybdopterin-guanine dinucleotide biosynthesis protein A